jgi:hypothetical protein
LSNFRCGGGFAFGCDPVRAANFHQSVCVSAFVASQKPKSALGL